MISRRDLLVATACIAAAGTGMALKPRREVVLLKGSKLAEIVPSSFNGWVAQDTADPLAINGEGTLSAKLYNELVARVYTNDELGAQVSLLLAYGGRQSDELQLHRPEICYPAFGYQLVRNEPRNVPIFGSVTVPGRRLVAEAEGRRESIIYWSRMGEALPQDGNQQREARLQIAMEGIIPDGVLCRFSSAGSYPAYDWPIIEGFVRDMLMAIKPDKRKVLIGSHRAKQIA